MSRLLPRGAVVAGLGRRFAAAILDLLPVGLLYGVVLLAQGAAGTVALVVGILGALLIAAYGVYQWWAYATRGAGLGSWLLNLRVVDLSDGEAIGWWRYLLRQLVLTALLGTVVGGIALLVFLVLHERRRGWHDLVAGSVVVEPKGVPVAGAGRSSSGQSGHAGAAGYGYGGSGPVSGSGFGSPNTGGFGGYGAQGAPRPGVGASFDSLTPQAPDWLPGVQSEPLYGQQKWQPQPLGSQRQAPFPGSQPRSAESPTFPPPPPPPTAPALPANKSWIPLPTPTSVIEPSAKTRQRQQADDDDFDGTRIAPLPTAGGGERGGDEDWYVRLDDGREVELSVTVLLGRNPQRTDDDPDEVHLVPASGDGRMISRTHVLIGTDPRGVFVVDRGSTNGTALVTDGGDLEPAPEGTQVRVREGQQVSYGNRWFTVLRHPHVEHDTGFNRMS